MQKVLHYKEQEMPLFIAFVDLTKLHSIYEYIWCLPFLVTVITLFHKDMKVIIQLYENVSDRSEIKNGVQLVCVLAPTLFGIYLLGNMYAIHSIS